MAGAWRRFLTTPIVTCVVSVATFVGGAYKFLDVERELSRLTAEKETRDLARSKQLLMNVEAKLTSGGQIYSEALSARSVRLVSLEINLENNGEADFQIEKVRADVYRRALPAQWDNVVPKVYQPAEPEPELIGAPASWRGGQVVEPVVENLSASAVGFLNLYRSDDGWEPTKMDWEYVPEQVPGSQLAGEVRRGQSRRLLAHFLVRDGVEAADILRFVVLVTAKSVEDQTPRTYRWTGLTGAGRARSLFENVNEDLSPPAAAPAPAPAAEPAPAPSA